MSIEDSVREYIPLEKIQLDPNQPRKSSFGEEDEESKADLRNLKKSIQELGILDPIKVVPNKEGKYIVIDGHRRATIARELGRETIKADVFQVMDPQVFQKARYHMQNMIRDWKPLERAELFQQLKNTGFKTNKEVASYIGVSESLVGKSMHLRGYKLQFLELMAQYHLPGTYDIYFARLKEKLRKIKEIEIDKIIRILLDKIRYKVITNARDLTRVGKVFLRASMHEDELYEFLTTDMTVQELSDKVELTGSVAELERVIDLVSSKLQKGESFTQKELEGIESLQRLFSKIQKK